MTFKIPFMHKRELPPARLLRDAIKTQLFLLQPGQTEYNIDKVLRKQYKIGIIEACLAIIDGAKFRLNFAGDLLVAIDIPKLDKLARLISFGNGLVPGSNILTCAVNTIAG